MQTGKGNADKETVAIEMQMLFDLDYDEIAIPVLYKRDDPKGKYKTGDVRERLFDPSDAIALCWAYHQNSLKERLNMIKTSPNSLQLWEKELKSGIRMLKSS